MATQDRRFAIPSAAAARLSAERSLGLWRAPFGGASVVFGAGTLAGLGGLAAELAARHVLLVTDPGVRKAGHGARAEASLASESLRVSIFDGVEENPTTRHVEQGAAFARGQGIDLIVGLGGGSAMDCAKGINFLVTNGGRMEDYWGAGRAVKPMLPSIGIPTTAGTGSEMQSFALIEQEGSRRKMACGDEKARFAAVILDPDLTATCPRGLAAVSGLDAISHSIESYVSTRGNPISRMLARQAWSLLSGAFASALSDPADAEARGRMLLGAHLAGAAIEASMLGAAHACANPLTSGYGVAHGAAVLLMLPHVIRYNEPVAGRMYAELLAADQSGSSGGIAERVTWMRDLGGLPARLRDAGVPEEALARLAGEAAQQWTAEFNPRPVSERDLRTLYESAY